MNRPERFGDQDSSAADSLRPLAPAKTFPIEAGGVYVLRVLLLGDGKALIAGSAALHCEFSDSDGFIIPPDYDRLVAARADARTMPVEVYSRRFQSAFEAADYVAIRLIVAPPRAAAVSIVLAPEAACEVRRLELERIGLADLRGVGDSQTVAAFGAAIERLRAALRTSGAGDLPAGVDLRRPLQEQIAARAPKPSQFDWQTLHKEALVPYAMDKLDKRRRLAARDSIVAFIGNERLYHKLASHAHVLLVDEADPAETLELRPDALVIEAGADSLFGGWRQQLCSAAGRLSPAAGEMLARARRLKIPVRVIARSRRDELELYRELLGAADLVLLEGLQDGMLPVDWLPPGRTIAVPRSFERTVAAPVIDVPLPGFRVTVANAAAILNNEAHAGLIAALDAPNLLLAEPFVDLSETQLSRLLRFSNSALVGTCQYMELLYFFQHSDAVLLCMDAPVLDEELQDLVVDATACGATVIALGDTARLGSLAAFVTPAAEPSRVFELLGLYGHVHYREQLWLSRYRALCREHGFERIMRLLHGGGPAQDMPLASIVTATKRPHLLGRILANYSRQTYPNKELILVLHGAPDAVLDLPPDLAASVRVIYAPASVNLGFCLNAGIRQAAGDFWFKADDDDYYGPHYIEDMINAYRFSGADLVAKPTYLVYLEQSGQTVCRTIREARKRQFYNPDLKKVPRLTGATLSARRGAGGPFSLRRRSGIDSEWTERMANAGQVLFSSDYLNFVVYRGADKSHHTWMMADERFLSSGTLMGSGLTAHLA